jgi:hypothetical protein
MVLLRRLAMLVGLAVLGTACLVTGPEDDDTITDDSKKPCKRHCGGGGGSGSDADLTAIVMPTPRDHNLEYIVGLASMAVVIVPGVGLRRHRRDDAARTA